MKISGLFLLLSLLLSATMISCTKDPVCSEKLNLKVDNPKPTVGETFIITSDRDTDEDVFDWTRAGATHTTNSNTYRVDNASISNRGWYYVRKWNSDCGAIYDSVYVDVQLPQETPPCSPGNNIVTFSSIPGLTATRVTRETGGVWGGLTIRASGAFGYPTFTIVFNSYFPTLEPEDGVYITKNVAIFSPTDEQDRISVSFIYSSNYFHCYEGKKVYVKHVNGKLQISFCDMPFASPPLPATTGSGAIREL